RAMVRPSLPATVPTWTMTRISSLTSAMVTKLASISPKCATYARQIEWCGSAFVELRQIQQQRRRRFFCEPWFELVLTTGDFDQVITELSLDRTLYFTDRSTEYHLIKFGDHLATTEGAQVATVAAGGAAGI